MFFYKLKKFISLVTHGPFDLQTEEGRERERERKIALTAFSAAISRGLSMVVPLITVRVTLQYMGSEIYGLWNAFLSFFVAFSFADLGLGSGLMTELSKSTAMEDEKLSKKIVSSCYSILLFTSIVLILIFLILYPVVDWSSLVNAKSSKTILLAASITFAIVIPKILNIPVALISRTQLAMQEGYISNLWECVSCLLNLFLVLIICYLDLGVLTLIWVYASIPVVVSFLNSLIYFRKTRPELEPSFFFYDKKISRSLLAVGLQFCFLSILTSISFSIDNFIVANVCGLTEVTSFSIFYKIVSIIGAICLMVSYPLWTANGEALQKGDYSWVKKTTKKISLLSSFFALICSVGVFIFIKPALSILTAGIVTVDYMLLMPLCLFQIVVAFTNPYFMILNGGGVIKFQIVNYIFYALIALPFKFILGNYFGVVAIAWAGVLLYIFLLTIPTIYRSLHLLVKYSKK